MRFKALRMALVAALITTSTAVVAVTMAEHALLTQTGPGGARSDRAE